MTAAHDLPCLKASRAGAGCELLVQVVPNAGRTVIAGLHDGALRVRLAAPPIEGRANAELLQWLARALEPAAARRHAGWWRDFAAQAVACRLSA
jgi:hypothetical protein